MVVHEEATRIPQNNSTGQQIQWHNLTQQFPDSSELKSNDWSWINGWSWRNSETSHFFSIIGLDPASFPTQSCLILSSIHPTWFLSIQVPWVPVEPKRPFLPSLFTIRKSWLNATHNMNPSLAMGFILEDLLHPWNSCKPRGLAKVPVQEDSKHCTDICRIWDRHLANVSIEIKYRQKQRERLHASLWISHLMQHSFPRNWRLRKSEE